MSTPRQRRDFVYYRLFLEMRGPLHFFAVSQALGIQRHLSRAKRIGRAHRRAHRRALS